MVEAEFALEVLVLSKDHVLRDAMALALRVGRELRDRLQALDPFVAAVAAWLPVPEGA